MGLCGTAWSLLPRPEAHGDERQSTRIADLVPDHRNASTITVSKKNKLKRIPYKVIFSKVISFPLLPVVRWPTRRKLGWRRGNTSATVLCIFSMVGTHTEQVRWEIALGGAELWSLASRSDECRWLGGGQWFPTTQCQHTFGCQVTGNKEHTKHHYSLITRNGCPKEKATMKKKTSIVSRIYI